MSAERRAGDRDERALILQVQAGDDQAFREMVELYRSRVYGIALTMLRDRELAMDVSQEIFVKIYRNINKFKGGSRFYTWLYRIAVNLCIDQLRKTGRSRETEAYDEQQHGASTALASHPPDPVRALENSELRQHLGTAMQTLSPNHRAVLLMREVEGLSYTEMAHVMGCSKGTIMSRLFHARRRLIAALEATAVETAKLASVARGR